KYILEQLQKGKAITLGECRFRIVSSEGSLA
ncbi:MAG: hypothetical protein QG567_1753, partial [Campylobacterota bacterium]|nr:hypothetical protein [Campylobacterota bacterium]